MTCTILVRKHLYIAMTPCFSLLVSYLSHRGRFLPTFDIISPCYRLAKRPVQTALLLRIVVACVPNPRHTTQSICRNHYQSAKVCDETKLSCHKIWIMPYTTKITTGEIFKWQKFSSGFRKVIATLGFTLLSVLNCNFCPIPWHVAREIT